jgi:hypothetical protein
VPQAQPGLLVLKVAQVRRVLQVQPEQLVRKDFQLLGLLDHRELRAQREIPAQQVQPATPDLKDQQVQPDLKVL